jgi:hypothetical protein
MSDKLHGLAANSSPSMHPTQRLAPVGYAPIVKSAPATPPCQ